MRSFEENTHVFIIRIWREPREIAGARPEWRGMIEHTPSGERRYVRDLDDLSAFIATYLAEMGVTLSLCWRLRQWLKRGRKGRPQRPNHDRPGQENNSGHLP